MSDLPLCGYGWEGFGCGKPIESAADLYRCADCKTPFHHYCLVKHFGDGVPREIEGMGKVTKYKMIHDFGIEMGWLVAEILKRDEEIKRLKESP